MKRIILIFGLLLLINPFSLLSQDTISPKYFPLNVGNKWIYDCTRDGELVKVITEIERDTIFENNKYFFARSFPFFLNFTGGPHSMNIWLRYDSTSSIFKWRYGFNNFKIEYDLLKFNSNIGDSLHSFVCYSIQDTMVFNQQTTFKFFRELLVTNHTSDSRSVITAKNFGIENLGNYHGSIIGSFSLNFLLKGCVVNGVVHGDTNLIGIVPITNEIPNHFSLSQNYPNPFNPNTKISYSITKTSYVRLRIFDALGREIETLVNEELQPGTYETVWNALNYPSGIYYYKLSAESFSETKKMVLIK